MFNFRRLLFFLRNKLRRESGSGIAGEIWEADFSNPAVSRFDIKSESAYDAYLRGGSLVLGLKKPGCIAWVGAPGFLCRDQIIEARLRIDPMGGYAASGLLFRMIDEGTCYMFLVSNRAYFRLDVLRNGMPFPLIGWTEVPGTASPESGVPKAPGVSEKAGETEFTVKVVAYGNHLVFFVNGEWAAELNDSSISSGDPGFVLVSYEAGPPAGTDGGFVCAAFLDALSINTGITDAGAAYEEWDDSPKIPPESHLALAETFAAMSEPNPALVQLQKTWKRRKGGERAPGELLLASRLARQLGLYGEAGEYIDACLAMDGENEAVTEKAQILYSQSRFEELRGYLDKALVLRRDDPVLHTLLGHVLLNLGKLPEAAEAYDKAFELDGGNGLPAKNAANVYEMLGRKEEALKRYLAAGNAFLAGDNYHDLGILIPKLRLLGKDSWEAHTLAGKWAFGIEDWIGAETEFDLAEDMRGEMRPEAPKDPSMIFLRALLLVREGRRRQAIPLFEEAVRYAPDYGLFHFRLAENRFLLSGNAGDPVLKENIEAALRLLSPEEETFGWASNLAAQIELQRGSLETARKHFEKAAALLGEVPEIRVNRGVFFFLQGSIGKALEILDTEAAGDPAGLMANCAGNLLVRSRQYEEADAYYRKALARSPGNVEYMVNRVSCLVKLERYGEADELLALAHSKAPSPEILELISYVAVKKGEFSRAEMAVNSALEIDPFHVPSLLSLTWLCVQAGRWDEAGKLIDRLNGLDLTGEQAESREELRRRWENGVYRFVSCTACGRNWRLPRKQETAPPIRLYAMPPDDLPAGSCTECGRTLCIGCAKEHLDENGRFLCPECGRTLKLLDNGLKWLVYNWASAEISGQKSNPPDADPPPAAPDAAEPLPPMAAAPPDAPAADQAADPPDAASSAPAGI
jgi:tetratricopeptide (TPR) repeat protein